MLFVGCATLLCHLFSLLLLPVRQLLCGAHLSVARFNKLKMTFGRARIHNSTASNCTSSGLPTINTMNMNSYFSKLFVNCAWIDDADDVPIWIIMMTGTMMMTSMIYSNPVGCLIPVTAHSNEIMCAAFISPNRYIDTQEKTKTNECRDDLRRSQTIASNLLSGV